MGTRRQNVFISYSHQDRRWLERLETVLRPLARNHTFTIWADTRIEPGAAWTEEILKAVASARVAILLVSPDYLASEFVTGVELPHLLAASKEGLRIVWIAVSACLWAETPIGAFQAANDPGRPLDSLSEAEVNRQMVLIAEAMKSALLPRPDLPERHELALGKRLAPWHGLRSIFSTALLAAAVSLLLGVFFRLWRVEAELDSAGYAVVFAGCACVISLTKWAWPLLKRARRRT